MSDKKAYVNENDDDDNDDDDDDKLYFGQVAQGYSSVE